MKIKPKKRTTVFILPVLLLIYILYPDSKYMPAHKTSLDDAPYLSYLRKTAAHRLGSKLPPKIQPLTDCYGTTFPTTTKLPKSSLATALVGIFTTAEKLERRMLIRQTMLQNGIIPPTLTFRFVICRNQTAETPHPYPSSLLLWESLHYEDIDLIDCLENMNHGKTNSWFNFAASNYSSTSYNFLLKTDDDTFIHPINLANDLNSMYSTEGNVYFGRGEDWKAGGGSRVASSGQNSSRIDNLKFFYGMLYGISWDVVLWIQENRSNLGTKVDGLKEDKLLPTWFHRLNKKIKYIDHNDETFLDHKWFSGGAGPWNSNYTKEAIAIHNVKSSESWLDSYRYYFGC